MACLCFLLRAMLAGLLPPIVCPCDPLAVGVRSKFIADIWGTGSVRFFTQRDDRYLRIFVTRY